MHLMLDFETLATRPDCKVLSLGAVLYIPGIEVVDLYKERQWFFEQSHQLGRSLDDDTLKWWMKQSPEAKKIFDECATNGIDLKQFVKEFIEWLHENCYGRFSHLKVWGNGATFDVSIMENILRCAGREIPWSFWNVMCYRTIKSFHHIEMNHVFVGEKHNALADARHQMKCLSAWLNK